MTRAALWIFLLCAPATAETLLSPSQFEQDAAGKTLYFRDTNGDFSAEQYRPDRRVTLLHETGSCMTGRWEPRGDEICFVYVEDPDRWHCWHYIEATDGGRLHRLTNEASAVYELFIVGEDTSPLECPGPGVGVSYTPSSPKSEP